MTVRNISAIVSENAPAAIGPYSQGVIAGGFLFVSGQLPIDPKTGEYVPGGIEKKAERAIKNIEAIAEAAGTDLSCVVKVTVYLGRMADFEAVNKVYSRYFDASLPARSVVQAAALPRRAEIEIEAIIKLPTPENFGREEVV